MILASDLPVIAAGHQQLVARIKWTCRHGVLIASSHCLPEHLKLPTFHNFVIHSTSSNPVSISSSV